MSAAPIKKLYSPRELEAAIKELGQHVASPEQAATILKALHARGWRLVKTTWGPKDD